MDHGSKSYIAVEIPGLEIFVSWILVAKPLDTDFTGPLPRDGNRRQRRWCYPRSGIP
jgi:hypothetical protein